jgi:hypothetical protein
MNPKADDRDQWLYNLQLGAAVCDHARRKRSHSDSIQGASAKRRFEESGLRRTGFSRLLLYRLPRTNSNLWQDEIEANRAHDLKVMAGLCAMAWKMIEAWECSVRAKSLEDSGKIFDSLAFPIRQNR